MDQALLAERAEAERDGGVALELDVGDPDEVVAARAERMDMQARPRGNEFALSTGSARELSISSSSAALTPLC